MEKISPLALAKTNSLSDLQLSPDGKHLAFVVSKINLKDNNYQSSLYLYQIKKQVLKQLTSGKLYKDLTWLDNQTLSFKSKRLIPIDRDLKTGTTYYQIKIDGGEAQPLFT